MEKKFRVGVIGAGAIAQALHIRGYAAAKNCELVAIADPVKRCLAQVRKNGWHFAREYRDYRKMLASETLDVVSICTPNYLHAEMAIAALNSGADILLEKPVALSVSDALKIDRAARKNRKRVMVGFSHRFNQNCVRTKAALDAGMIGKPYMARIRFAHTGPFPGWAKTDWFYNPKQAGGGALLDMGIHAFDLMQWFLGPATAIQAKAVTLRKPIKVDDNALCILEFGKKALGYIDVGWTSPSGFSGVEIMGDKGAITIDYSANRVTMTSGTTSPSGKMEMKTEFLSENAPSYWAGEMVYFTGMLGSKKPFAITMKDGILALKAALAAQKSSRTGRRIVIA